jgi:hypothetical protein
MRNGTHVQANDEDIKEREILVSDDDEGTPKASHNEVI